MTEHPRAPWYADPRWTAPTALVSALPALWDTPPAAAALAAATGVTAALTHPRAPLTALALAAAATTVTPLLGIPTCLLAYRCGRTGTALHPRHLAGAAALTLALAAAALTGAAPLSADAVAALPLYVALPWAVGAHRRALDLLARHRQQEQEHRARLRERARIAHDMHDSLGHDLGLLAVRAAALEVAPDPTPDQARAAAAELRRGAARATEHLRQVIGVLHPHTPETTPADDLPDLLDRARAAGMDIHTDLDRDHGAPDPVARAVHRIVQEALTNAARHAPDAPVTVRVHTNTDATDVTVANTAARRTPQPPGGGTGLAAARERARALGGTLHAGPHGDGFAVRAHLPHHAPATTPPAEQPPAPTADRRRLRRDLLLALALTLALTCTATLALAAYT
ncbi:sensor histidine kinase [Nocardiopsis sp. NPDC057823]|uniref:sensor histidine kinase n=1 Tax=Nocardiopsis sp. NPDC057823 TaxID=3346256 RepID=UPI00366E4E12